MTVTVTASVSTPGVGLYVPFRGTNRANGPCGTLDYVDTATGDSGGGAIQIVATATRLMFGFHPMLVLRCLNTHDNQAAATSVRVGVEGAGNERTQSAYQMVDIKNDQIGTVNVNVFPVDHYQLIIEPDQLTESNILTFNWETNTDGKVYNARAFFIVYDLEALSKGGVWTPPDGFTNQ